MVKAASTSSSDQRWRFSDAYDTATSRPQGYISFKIQNNSATIASGNVMSWRLGVNTSAGQGTAANNYLDFRFLHGSTANNLVMQSPGGASVGQVTATISTTAPVIMKIWYNKTGSTMDYTDPSGAAKILNPNSYVAYAGNTLLSPASTGSAMVTAIGTDTTVGKMAFSVGTSNACDFLIDDVYAAASAPVLGLAITSPTTATAQAGYPFSYRIESSGVTTPSYSTSPLPSGLNVDSSTGVISGTISAGANQGLNNITLTATGTGGPASGTLGLTITAPPIAAPTFNSAATASGFLTRAFTYQIGTSMTSPSSTPTSYAIASGDLSTIGLNLNTATGLISGTPTALTPDGGTQITYTATNPFGKSAEQTLTITINPAPVFTWNNTSTVWNNATSWTNNAVPANSAATDIAAFGNLGGSPTSVDVGTGRSIGGIVFNSGAFAYTWTGTDITVGGTTGITNNAAVTQTFGNKIINVSADATWSSVSGGSMVFNGGIDLGSTGVSRKITFAGAGNATVNGAIANGGTSTAGQVAKIGAGTLLLNGTNTFLGSASVAEGTMILSGPNSTAAYTISALTDNAGPVLKLTLTNAMSSSAILTGSSSLVRTGTLDLATAGDYIVNQYNVGNMNFTTTSGAKTTLTFTNANNVMSAGGGRTIANQITNLTVTFSGSLDIAGTTADNCSISGVGPIVISNRIYNSNISFIRGLTKKDAGTLTIYGTNSYNGTTTVSGGTLVIPAGGSLANCGNTIVKGSGTSVGNSASLNLAGAAGVVQVSTNGFVRGGGSITDLQVQDVGTVEVAVGTTWITGGTIDFAAGSKVSVTGTPTAGNTYTLMTASSAITGSIPTLEGVTDWQLDVEGTELKLKQVQLADGFSQYLVAQSLLPGTAFDEVVNGSKVGLQYTFGSPTGMPQNNGVTAVPVMSGNQLTYTFDVKDDSALQITYETSTDLVNWDPPQNVTPGSGITPSGFVKKQAQATGSGKLFIRINVTR